MKERLDLLMVRRNLCPSREKAKALIMAGNVFVNGQREDKAGTSLKEDCKIEIKTPPLEYVSRGGLKLKKAIDSFGIDLKGKICADAGSSTGGFTDCMLRSGAKSVYAIDVGRGQLDWKLRQDERVVCMEGRNMRYIRPQDIGIPIDFFSADVSFISLTKILKPVFDCLAEGGEAVALIKPQFEAGRENVGKGGVVKDRDVHKEVIKKVASFAILTGFEIKDIDFSPIKGPKGNIEYLIYIKKPDGKATETEIDLISVVDTAFETLAR